MAVKRKHLQGVANIVRFNWHFYAIALCLFVATLLLISLLPPILKNLAIIGVSIAGIALLSSLLISYFIYDLSSLYELQWIPDQNEKMVLNINAGFDETSEIIKEKFPNTQLVVCDFYDESKHTEISIKRARNTYPSYPNTFAVTSDSLPFLNESFDSIIAIFSAHEIRNDQERIQFFSELNRVLKKNGKVYITEHLRDFPNFIAYTIGFFHFHSGRTWRKTFSASQFKISKKLKTTPFVNTFILEKNGTTT